MKESLFRKKSLEKVTSPEQLNEYIRVSNPGLWVILTAIIVLLVGACFWGAVGRLETVLPVAAIGENGEMSVYIREDDAASVEPGMEIRLNDGEYTVNEIAARPTLADGTYDRYALHVGGIDQGEWFYIASVNGEYCEGIHSAEIVIESVSPMSFIWN